MSEEISSAERMASSIHDLKNNFNLQLSALEQMARQCQARGETASLAALGDVLHQSHRMSLQLVEMLSLYKLGQSHYPVEMQEQPVAEVIQEVVLQTRFMMSFKNISVTVDCAEDCSGYFDRELVKGVLVNALNNAYLYTRDAIRIAARQQGPQLELRVEDNGPGYPQNVLNSDLSAGQAVHWSSGSTGLGFYFCERVARLHKNGSRRGQLQIENGGQLGGACLVLTLP